jgi:catalase
MTRPDPSPARSVFGSLLVIALVVGGAAAAFAYTAGWLSPERITPDKLVDAFTPPGGEPPLGHRRNHAKGICFTGTFDANGAGAALSRRRCSPVAAIPPSGASTSPRSTRTRGTARSAFVAWGCASRHPTARNGAPP